MTFSECYSQPQNNLKNNISTWKTKPLIMFSSQSISTIQLEQHDIMLVFLSFFLTSEISFNLWGLVFGFWLTLALLNSRLTMCFINLCRSKAQRKKQSKGCRSDRSFFGGHFWIECSLLWSPRLWKRLHLFCEPHSFSFTVIYCVLWIFALLHYYITLHDFTLRLTHLETCCL